MSRKLVRFGVVGGICVGLNVLAFWVLVERLGFNYLIVTAIAFFMVGAFGYLLNRVWAFESRDAGIAVQVSRFYLVQALVLIASLASMRLLVGILGMSVLAACVVQSAVFASANFAAHCIWTFRRAN